MASPRMLARLVSITSSISAGAVIAIQRQEPGGRPPAIVRELLRLVAETISTAGHPDEKQLQETESILIALIVRYGTMRVAIESLGNGSRRVPGISHEKANSWTHVFSASHAQVESVFRRSPHLILAVGKWIAAQGDSLEARLGEYPQWLDGPISGLAAAPAAPVATMPVVELAPVRPTVAPAPPARPGELDPLLRGLIEAKRLSEFGQSSRAPRLTADVAALAQRLAGSQDPHVKCAGLIALGRFAEADAMLPGLRGKIAEADLWTLWGERNFFDGRYDDAVESFRSARNAHDSSGSRRNLAAALLHATRPSAEVHIRAAIDLLAETARSLDASSPDRAAIETMLGFAWRHHAGADRDADVRRAIEHLETALGALSAERDPAAWAEAHLELGNAWNALPSGRKLENVQRAITCFERAAQVWTRQAEPERWANLQNHLGQSWEKLPAGERAFNIERAIAYFQAAMEVKTREADPAGWATLQNNIGIAWAQMPGGDHSMHIGRAIECHQQALEVWSASNRRAEWAATQNNLGIAWAMLPSSGEAREKNLRRAIAAYKAALDVRTRGALPAEWAATQSNLGSTYLHLPVTSDGASVKEAVACFERALEVRTREAMPLDWAKSQSNLGTAWSKMPGDKVSNLQKAVECFDAALVVFTKASHPHQHEHISQKKAEALDTLDDLQIMGKG